MPTARATHKTGAAAAVRAAFPVTAPAAPPVPTTPVPGGLAAAAGQVADALGALVGPSVAPIAGDRTLPRVGTGEGVLVSVSSTFEIAAAHRLPYHQGKCRRLHGHNYRLVFTRYGTDGLYDTPRPDAGMVLDFGDFDDAIKVVLAKLDHYNLNDTLTNPTAERLAVLLLDKLPLVDKVEVWETSRHCAVAERYVRGGRWVGGRA